jgi:transmembrane sensor
MTLNREQTGEEIATIAADWVVRLARSDADEGDFLAFDQWLDVSPRHGWAYDQALSLWQEVERRRPILSERLAAYDKEREVKLPKQNWRLAAIAGTLAASLLLGWMVWPQKAPVQSHPWQSWQTAKGERSTVMLADGSRVDLAADSRISVRFDGETRQVAMQDGEAMFDIAKDAQHPFLIKAGDHTVRVVGTAFDVRLRGDQLSVSVLRGIVEVTGADGNPVRLTPGKRFDHQQGVGDQPIIETAVDDIFAWKSGRLIYRDRPLSEVVADLNAQFSQPVVFSDQRLADIKFSGVLVLDDEEKVVRRLTLLTPLFSSTSPTGIVLRAKEASAQ